jgi:hypothetical protein
VSPAGELNLAALAMSAQRPLQVEHALVKALPGSGMADLEMVATEERGCVH